MRKVFFVLIAALALGGTYMFFRPQAVVMPSSSSSPAAAPAAAARPVELTVVHGALQAGPTVVKITQGDTATLRIVSDRADELHLHGYDLHLELKPNEPATLTFVANRSGRFTYELHHGNVELGAFEVYPRP